jgi:3-phenylpropionate/trans-cinnamate dioxygenase ferredoxin reductase subunit
LRSTKYLLIGGGLASHRAAGVLSLKDPGAPVTLVAKETRLPYDRPPLSKEFLRGEKTENDLTYDPPSFFEEKKIELILGDPAVEIDPARKHAVLASGAAIQYEKALIATGGEPVRLGVPGSSLAGIHYLRTIEDAAAIRRDTAPGRRAAIVGAGFIGMELAASLASLGLRVVVIEAFPRIWGRFLDTRLSAYVRERCEKKGITFHTGEKLREFAGENRVSSVLTESGLRIDCDFVCVGVGIRPSVELARSAGLLVDNGIVVDERLAASHPDIYAAGDAVNFPDPVSGRRRRVEHWGHAEYGGQIAGMNMAGIETRYDLMTYAWSDIFDLHLEFAGDETGYDRTLVRGSLGDSSFIVLYLAGDTLRAYLAVNANSREYPKLQRIIRGGVSLAGKDVELADPLFDLRTLL